MDSELLTKTREDEASVVSLPAPTAWPIVLAFGVTLVFAGLLTMPGVSVLGAILAIRGYIGWFCEVLPHEKHEFVPVLEGTAPVTTSRPEVSRVEWITHEQHRARLPLEIYPISAGVKGGLAGSIAMAILAVAYGIVVHHSIWYPINLLTAGFFPASEATTVQLSSFQPLSFVLACIIHLTTSLLVGLLYGAMLPMFPRRPILLGGFVAPVLWSALIHNVLELLNPVLNQRIDWLWFFVSQVGFGIVAGIVVSKQVRIRTWQHLPFAVRAGFETPGPRPDDEKNGRT
jgi:hypothetical protein